MFYYMWSGSLLCVLYHVRGIPSKPSVLLAEKDSSAMVISCGVKGAFLVGIGEGNLLPVRSFVILF